MNESHVVGSGTEGIFDLRQKTFATVSKHLLLLYEYMPPMMFPKVVILLSAAEIVRHGYW